MTSPTKAGNAEGPSPAPGEMLARYDDLPPDIKKYLGEWEAFIGDIDGVTTVHDDTIDASDAVWAFNGIVAALRKAAQ